MFLVFNLCFILLFKENYALKDTLNKKNLQFVQKLKHDLRRNNDDYAELKVNNLQTNNTQQSVSNFNLNDIRYKIITTRDVPVATRLEKRNNIHPTTLKGVASYNGHNNGKEDVRLKIIDNIRRRVNDALISKEVTHSDDSDPQRRAIAINDNNKNSKNDKTTLGGKDPTLRSLWNEMHNYLQKKTDNVNRYRIKLLSNKTNTNHLSQMLITGTTQSINSKKTKRVKKDKMEKFKKFIEKNKGLLKEFINSKKLAASMSLVTPSTQLAFAQTQSKLSGGLEINKVMRQAVKVLNNKKNLGELPNAAMLDMFPAKGGRIHSKRVKGHLCHRNVLIPEGPKYNSLGRIYLPPHAAAHIAHEYNATDVPKLLLPRCCNCCRKSVLGCE